MLQPCPKCQNQNRPDAKFCAYCRTPLIASEQPAAPPAAIPVGGTTCPQCGKVVNPRAKFCNYCGQVLAQAALAALVPPSATAAAAASPPPPYTPPAYSPPKQGLSRRQTTVVVASSVAVIAALVILVIVAGKLSPTSPATSVLPTATTTPAFTLPPQETRQSPTVTPKSVQDVPPAAGTDGRRCVMPPPDRAAVSHFVKQDETLYGIADSCGMNEREFRIFLRWNQLDPNARPNDLPRLKLDDCLWIPAYCIELLP
jgi:hypothetical protein